MPTALTTYLSNIASTTVTTANKLFTTSGSPTTTSHYSKTGSGVTGWGELWSQGNAGSWSATGSEPSPSAHGFLLDSTLLEGNTLASGNYSGTVQFAINGTGTNVIDIHCRLYKRSSGGTYTLIVDIDLGSVSLTTTGSTVSIPSTAASSMAFASGDKLYCDFVGNSTSSTTAGGPGFKILSNDSSGSTGSTSAQLVTPGYDVTSGGTTYTTTVNETLSTAYTESTISGSGSLSVNETLSTAYAESTNVGSGATTITDSIGTPDAVVTVSSSTLVTTTIAEQLTTAYAESTLSGSGSTTITDTTLAPNADSTISGSGATTIAESLASLSAESTFSGNGSTSVNEQLSLAYVESTISGAGSTTISDVTTTPYAESTQSGSGSTTIAETLNSAYAETQSASSAYIAPVVYPALANDMFNRANQSGFGTATDGNVWNVDTGAATLSILSNQGKVTGVSALTFLREGSASSADFDITVQVSANSTNYLAVGVYGRQTASNTAYRARINTNDSSQGFGITKTIAGTSTTLVSMAYTASLNTLYNVRFRGVGSLLFAKVWGINTIEPTAWSLSTTDSSITGSGTVGIVAYTTNSSDIALFDNFYALDYAEHERITSFDASATTQAIGVTAITEQLSSADAIATFSTSTIANNSSILEQLTTFDAPITSVGSGATTVNETLLTAYAESTCSTANSTTINEQMGTPDAIATQFASTPFMPYPALVNDMYMRANQSGFGTATDGNTYTVDSGAATLSVNANQGQITGVTGLTFIREGSNTSADFDISAQVSASSTNYTALGVYGRQTATNTAYRARISTNDSSIGFAIVKTIAGTTTNLVTMAYTISLNTLYNIRFRGVGSLLFAKVWALNTAEPTSWSLSTTDTSITGSGTLGLVVNTTSSSDVAIVDNLYAIDYATHVRLTSFDAVASTQASIPINTTVVTEQLAPDATASTQSSAVGNVTSQQVTLSNTGTDDGTWSASSNASWLLVSPLQGTLTAGDSTTITVSTNSNNLAPGTYNATLTLVMSNSNTVQIPVSLTIVSSSSAPQSVTLTNTGGASGNWNATISSGAPWLSLSATSGTLAAQAMTTINVSVDTSNLAVGTYSASVTFAIQGANSIVVPVTVTVGSSLAATAGIAPTSLTFNGIVGSSTLVTQDVTLSNTGNQADTYTGSVVYGAGASGWLNISPQSGSLPASGTQVIACSLVNSAALAAGTYSATVTYTLGGQSVSTNVTLVMQTTTQGSTQTVLIAEQPVTVEWPLVVTNKIDEQSTADFIILDATGTLVLSQNAQVIINDSVAGVVFKGYIATVESNNKRLYPNPHTEHIVACKDERYLAAKRLFTGKDYANRLAGDIVADLMQGYLTPEGVSASYAIRHDNSTATFGQGTLTNTIANNDVELAPAGSAYSVNENFFSGALTNLYVGSGGSALQLRPCAALKLVGTASQGISNTSANQTGNNYYYAKIWGGNVSIASGDTLQYGMWISSTSPEIKSGVDGICSDGTTLRDYNNRYLLDQNHLALHPGTDLSGYANDQWYTRIIDLTPIAGKALSTISIAFEGDNTGTYTSYFRSVWLIDSGGNVKQNFYVGTLNANASLSNIGYSRVALTQITAYEKSGMRVSSANSIPSVGVVQSSTIAWTADTTAPKDTALLVESSIDGGATWQACTSGMALPSLLSGANAKTITILTRQRLLLTGPSPELTPTLYALAWTVTPSYASPKTDVQKIETTQADFTGGTNNAVSASNGDISLNGVWRDWRSSGVANQTFFGYGSQGTVTGQAVVTIAPGGKEGRSRLDFAGTWSDFIAELDVTVSPHGNASFVYRTTNWQTANNYHGYNVDLTATQVLFGRGSSSGTYTQIATAAIDLSQGTSFRLTVIASGSNHRIYINGGLYINATDTTYTSGQFGLRFLNNDTSVTYSGFFGNFGVVQALTGTHVSNAVSLNGVTNIGTSVVQWDADIPQGGNVDVSVSFDQATWTSCTNGQTVPGFVNGGTNTQSVLYVRTTVSSGNAAASAITGRDLNTYLTPTVHGVTLWIVSQLSASGTRISPALQLGTVGVAGSTSVSWSQVAPAGTSVGIDVSLNGGASWTDMTTQNGGSIPGINQGDTLTGKSVVTRVRLLSTVPALTPQVTDLTLSVRNGDIQSGALIPSTSYSFQNKIDSCLDDLASKSNFWWAIKNGRLLFQNKAGIPAPWVLDSSNATTINGQAIGDVLLNPAPRLMKRSDKYRNRQWIINALTPTTSPVSEQKIGDGKTQSWTLTYPISQGSLSIMRNGNVASIGVQGFDVGRDFYYTPGQPNLIQNPNVAPLQAANGTMSAEVLLIVYTGLTPQPVMAEDKTQQEVLADIDNTTGIIEEVEDANTLYPNGLLADAAQQLAQARIDQYATLGREWSSSTLRPGLDAGMLQTVNVPEIGLSNVAMLITQIKINYMPGLTRYDMTYVEGYNPKSWENYYTPN